MKKLGIVLVLLLMSLIVGCVGYEKLTIEQGQRIAGKYGIRSEIIWSSKRGNPWADGSRIYIDLNWVQKKGLSHRLGPLLLHEEYHNFGYGHCKNSKCLMYHKYQVDLILGSAEKRLCGDCQRK